MNEAHHRTGAAWVVVAVAALSLSIQISASGADRPRVDRFTRIGMYVGKPPEPVETQAERFLRERGTMQSPAGDSAPAAPAPFKSPFAFGTAKLEGGYVVGTVTNVGPSGFNKTLEIEIAVYEADGARIETATGSIGSLGRGETWRYRAIVQNTNAATVKIVRIGFPRKSPPKPTPTGLPDPDHKQSP